MELIIETKTIKEGWLIKRVVACLAYVRIQLDAEEEDILRSQPWLAKHPIVSTAWSTQVDADLLADELLQEEPRQLKVTSEGTLDLLRRQLNKGMKAWRQEFSSIANKKAEAAAAAARFALEKARYKTSFRIEDFRMTIDCPNPRCTQKIALTVVEAGTRGLCPKCECNLKCPSLESFPIASQLPRALFGGSQITSPDGIELVWCPPGKFWHNDLLGDRSTGFEMAEGAFWIGKYPVTQAQWEKVMGTNPSHFKGPQNPVESINNKEAWEFCSKLEGHYVPATGSSWEYACRAGSTTRFCFGNDDAQLGNYAWFIDNSEGRTHPVGAKKSNPWGIHDMHGNVWEWGHYWGSGAMSNDSPRECRGGSWSSPASSCTSRNSTGERPDYRDNAHGLRVMNVNSTQGRIPPPDLLFDQLPSEDRSSLYSNGIAFSQGEEVPKDEAYGIFLLMMSAKMRDGLAIEKLRLMQLW